MSRQKKQRGGRVSKKKIVNISSSSKQGVQQKMHISQPDALFAINQQSEAYEEQLLDQVLTQWQFGDWDSLTQIERQSIEYHPERAKLAILVAAGHQQLNDMRMTKEFVKLAQEWGCDIRLIRRVLIGGVYNTLGRAFAILQNEDKALKHFSNAVYGIGGNNHLSCHARSVREITRLGLLKQAASLIEKDISSLSHRPYSNTTTQRINVLRTELDLLHHELSLAQQRHQLTNGPASIAAEIESYGHIGQLDKFKNKSVSQLGQDIWVLEKLNYKQGGFFVEFGATDGVLLSNTYLLEKEFGWQGICAEPNPKLFAQLQKNRSCICKNTCIAGTDNEEREFILADAYGSLASYEDCDQHKQKRQAYRESGEVITLRTETLHSFLKACKSPREIDYLSIDTEGSELEILQEFDFNFWQVKLLTVEHNFQEKPRQKIRDLLSRFGYQVQEAQWDDWFWRPDLINPLQKKPKVILSAGMPRSGSTWLFNAARLLLQSRYKISAKWIEDFEDADLCDVDILILKIHEFIPEWVEKADQIIYSYRDIRDAIASAERKFDRIPSLEQAKNLVDMDYKWKKVADFTLKYEVLFSEKESLLSELAKILDINVDKQKIKSILCELDQMSYNDPGFKNDKYNMTNLLHVDHVTNGGYGTWKYQLDKNLVCEIERKFIKWFNDFGYDINV